MRDELERHLNNIEDGEHICPIIDDLREQIVMAATFIRQGLESGDRCIFAADSSTEQPVRQELAAAGIDVAARCEDCALQFLNNRELYLKGGSFEPGRMIRYLAQQESDAVAAGYSGLHFVGDMNWALASAPGTERLIEYESSLNHFVSGSRSVVLCQYFRPAFTPAVIHDVIRTHPTVIFGELVYPNPYYEPPELLVTPSPEAEAEFKSKRLKWWLSRLEQARQEAAEREQLLERLQALSVRLIDVQEAERRRISRELHDEAGQILTGLRALLKPPLNADVETLQTRLKQAEKIVDEVFEIGQRLAFDLRPAVLDLLGLVPALLTLFERFSEQTGIQVDFKHENLAQRLSSHLETTAYRIVQEALTNVARHANTNVVTVRLWATDETLNIRVSDRGSGFDPQAVLASGRSNGLLSMQERVLLLNGRWSIDSRPGVGTEITAELPLLRRETEEGQL